MKFCKNLERVQTLSNPEWSPYWTDYKKLKKLIKQLSIIDHQTVDSDGLYSGECRERSSSSAASALETAASLTMRDAERRRPSEVASLSSHRSGIATSLRICCNSRSSAGSPDRRQLLEQQRGDSTSEDRRVVACPRPLSSSLSSSSSRAKSNTRINYELKAAPAKRRMVEPPVDENKAQVGSSTKSSMKARSKRMETPVQRPPQQQQRTIECMRSNPNEVAFFKLLHSEFHKAVHFFDRAIDEYSIREERVRDGLQIIKQQHRESLWNIFARSVYRLYTDLLLLETYCIMTYCGFSKILKKHDKRTGLETKNAFMNNVVNRANFTTYSSLQEMIIRCERLYTEVSERLLAEGNDGLYEDERLFIDMINQLNRRP